MKTLHLTITTAAEPIYDGDVLSVTIPGVAGEMTIHADHAPIVSLVKRGVITARTADGKETQHQIQEGGTLEVSHNTATVLL